MKLPQEAGRAASCEFFQRKDKKGNEMIYLRILEDIAKSILAEINKNRDLFDGYEIDWDLEVINTYVCIDTIGRLWYTVEIKGAYTEEEDVASEIERRLNQKYNLPENMRGSVKVLLFK